MNTQPETHVKLFPLRGYSLLPKSVILNETQLQEAVGEQALDFSQQLHKSPDLTHSSRISIRTNKPL